LLPGEELDHGVDHVLDEITPAAPSCPLAVLDDLIKRLLRLLRILPLGGWLRLDWLQYHKLTIAATQRNGQRR